MDGLPKCLDLEIVSNRLAFATRNRPLGSDNILRGVVPHDDLARPPTGPCIDDLSVNGQISARSAYILTRESAASFKESFFLTLLQAFDWSTQSIGESAPT